MIGFVVIDDHCYDFVWCVIHLKVSRSATCFFCLVVVVVLSFCFAFIINFLNFISFIIIIFLLFYGGKMK